MRVRISVRVRVRVRVLAVALILTPTLTLTLTHQDIVVPGFTPIQDELEHYERPGGLQQVRTAVGLDIVGVVRRLGLGLGLGLGLALFSRRCVQPRLLNPHHHPHPNPNPNPNRNPNRNPDPNQAMRAASARPGRRGGEARGGALLLFAGEAHLILHICPISTLVSPLHLPLSPLDLP